MYDSQVTAFDGKKAFKLEFLKKKFKALYDIKEEKPINPKDANKFLLENGFVKQ